MTTSDYLINGLLIGMVLLQIRGRRLTTFGLLLPLAIVTWAGFTYLHGIPTAGNDLVLVIAGATAGLVLGALTGLTTKVRLGADGFPFAKARATAAILWVLGVGTRLAFTLYATHGGGASIYRFSGAHGITSMEAWVAGLILMAFAEVFGRTGVLALRGRSVRSANPAVTLRPSRPGRLAVIMGTRDSAS